MTKITILSDIICNDKHGKSMLNSESAKCGICGENHFYKDCTYVVITNHIPDKEVPSKARLTLPDSLEIRTLADNSISIYAKILVDVGTVFGPFQAKKIITLSPEIIFPLKLFTNDEADLSEYFLDTSDENECSWMLFVNPANEFEEQNLICFQDGQDLYYGAIRDIKPGEPLKVWYSPYYASKMNKPTLTFNTAFNFTEAEPAEVNISEVIKKQQKIVPRDTWNCKFCYKLEKNIVNFAKHLMVHYRAQAQKKCTICNAKFLHKKDLQKHLKIVHNDLSSTNNVTVEPMKNLNKLIDLVKDVTVELKDAPVGGPLLLNNLMADSLDNSSLLLQQTDVSSFAIGNIENQNLLLENDNLNISDDIILNQNVKDLDHFNFEIKEAEPQQEAEQPQFVCDICLKPFVKLKNIIHHLDQHTGRFYCQECKKVYGSKENLKGHACQKFYQLKCSLCDKLFYQKKYLNRHLVTIHHKKFTCKNCNRYFYSPGELSTHICANVPEEKRSKFKCNQCPKIFFKDKYLQRHMQRHEVKKPDEKFICAVCSLVLNSKKYYLQHLKVHQEPSYRCELCDRKFQRSDLLKDHKVNVHGLENDPVKCSVCSKQVKSKTFLRMHMQTHADKEHKCDSCSKTFKQRTNLTRHIKRIHAESADIFNGEIEIFDCSICKKRMKLKRSILRHMRNFHPDEYRNYQHENTVSKKVQLGTSRAVDNNFDKTTDTTDQKCMDLKETIDNMDFTTDINACNENSDLNIENILNGTETIDRFLEESSDTIMDNLLKNIIGSDNEVGGSSIQRNELDLNVPGVNREVCLSMPDLTEGDKNIQLGKNAYILENGTIVEPQENTSDVVVYILNENPEALGN